MRASPFAPVGHAWKAVASQFVQCRRSGASHACWCVWLCAIFLVSSPLKADLLYDADTLTDGAQDGPGLGWNTSNINWWNTTTNSNIAWPNTSSSIAVFGAGTTTAGTVTVGTVTTNGITFAAPVVGNYTLSGGTITLDGSSPTLRTQVDATIGSVLAGSAGMVKAGSGVLTLNGVNTYSGTTTVTAGTLVARISVGENALGTSNVMVASGSTLRLRSDNTSTNSVNLTTLLFGTGDLEIMFTAGGTARNVIATSSFVSSFAGNIRLSTTTGAATSDKWNALGGITTAASLTIVQGTQLFINGGTSTFSGGINVIGTGNSENRGALRLISGLVGHITLGGNTTVGTEGGSLTGTITNSAASTLTFGGVSNGSVNVASSIQNGAGVTSITAALTGNTSNSTAGVLQYTGTTSNTYTGVTTIQGGVLQLGKTSGAIAIYGDGAAGTADVIIGSTAFAGVGTDTLRLAASNQIRDNVEIVMDGTAASLFTLVNGATNSSETIGSLASTNAAANVELGSGTLTVRNGRAGVGAATTFAGIISGTGSLVMDGADSGVFTVSGANTFSGSTTVRGGTLALNYDTASGSKLSDAAPLTLGTAALALTGATGTHVEVIAGTNVTGSAALLRSGGNTAQLALGALTLSTGAFLEVQSAGLATTTTSNTAGLLPRVTLGGVLAMNDGSGNIVAYNAFTDVNRLGGTMADAASAQVRITEAGSSGSVTLAASGTTTVSSLTNAGTAGLATVSIGTGNTLRLGAVGTVTSASTSQGLTITGGTLTAGGADNTAGEILVANYTSSASTIASSIANNSSAAVSLTKVGSGQLILSGSNTFTGGTLVVGGTLTVANTAALGAAAATVTLQGGKLQLATDAAVSSKSLVLNGSATLELDRATSGAGITTTFGTLNTTAGDFTLAVNKGANVTTGASSVVFNGTLSMNGRTTTFDIGADASVILSGISASGAQTISMIKNGQGTLVLGANNGSNFATWDGGSSTLLNEGTLDLRVIMGDSGVFRNLVAQGGATLRLTRDTDLDYRSSLTMDGSMQVVVDRLSASSTDLTHTLGALSLGGSTLTVSRGSSITDTAVAALTFAGATTLTGNATVAAGSSTRTTLSGVVSGVYSLTKSGAGTLVLANAANTYSGRTDVQAGTLQVGIAGVGSTGTGSVTIQNGATLLGTGVVQGNAFTAASGAAVHVGDSAAASSYGTLTFTPAVAAVGGAFDFQAGSTVTLGLNLSGVSDKLVFNGGGSNNLTFNANLVIGPASFTPTAATTFDLLDWTGLAASPTFGSQFTTTLTRDGSADNGSAWDLPDISGSGFYWDLTQFTVNGSISIVAVPEPTRLLLLAWGSAWALLRRRRCVALA